MKNFFEIFALPPRFEIDLDDLEKKYLEFQKRFHPDTISLRASTANIEQSITINEAYKILGNPISRASHILQLNSINIEDDSNAPRPDMTTLEEILKLQEKVAKVTEDEVENLRKYLSSKIKSLLEEVAVKLEKQDFKTAAQVLMKVKYFDKTLRDLKRKNKLN